MYIAMNCFKVIKEEGKAFEDHCRNKSPGTSKLCATMKAEGVTATLNLALKASGLDEA